MKSVKVEKRYIIAVIESYSLLKSSFQLSGWDKNHYGK